MSDEIDSYIQLQQQIHHVLRVQHPNWVEPKGDCPTCNLYWLAIGLSIHFAYSERLSKLLGFTPETEHMPPPLIKT